MAANLEMRNIVLIGKTGAGKSTVANKILGREAFHVKASTQSATSVITHEEATIIDYNITYKLKVVDTMGVFDTRDDFKSKKVTDDIKKYTRENISEGISLIVFVFKEGRFTAEEKAAFDVFMENFRLYTSDISALVITKCDEKDERGRDAVIQDFRRNHPNIAGYMKQGIYTVGFPDTKNMKPRLKEFYKTEMESDVDILKNLVKNAVRMRLSKEIHNDALWDLLCSCC